MFSLQFMISVFFICVMLCCEYVCSGESGQSCEKRRISCGPFEKPCNLAKPGSSPAENLPQSGTFHLVTCKVFLRSLDAHCYLTLRPSGKSTRRWSENGQIWADLGRCRRMQVRFRNFQGTPHNLQGDSSTLWLHCLFCWLGVEQQCCQATWRVRLHSQTEIFILCSLMLKLNNFQR